MLARQAGLPVRFSKRPRATGCYTSVGPWFVVPNADGYSYAITGLSRYVTEALADVPKGGLETHVGLARRYQALSSDVAKIPFWSRHAGERGRLAAEALIRFVLRPANSRYEFDPTHRRLCALDGLLWQNEGETPAKLAAAEHLRGCWYAGFHAGLWPLLGQHWRHIRGLAATLASEGDWATLDLGSGKAPIDARLNAAVYYARLAARLAPPDDYAAAHLRAVKLLVAAYALTAGAPAYAARGAAPYESPLRGGPWPSLAGLGSKPTALSRCWPGSLGLAPGPPPLVTRPSDAGYSLASGLLPDYFREKFRSGPFGLFGRSPAEWAQRAFVAIKAPDLGTSFRPVPSETGPYAGNYVYSVEPGPDGWPGLVWASHKAPAAKHLIFGTIGTKPNTRGKLIRSVVVSPGLRLSAFQAIEIPPPPKETEPPTPPKPEAPPAESTDDRPARSPPRNTPESAPGTGAPAK
jgi:hypothetical protein